jgi:2-polyprenyl-3-methyl-5-hydroxy-6-metoxy-1,4-benzoquinol methylase
LREASQVQAQGRTRLQGELTGPGAAGVVCVACAEQISVRGEFRRSDFVRCPTCRTIRRYSFPKERELNERYAGAYSGEAGRNDQTGFESSEGMLSGLASILRKSYLKPGDRVLDFGAGTGRFCNLLRAIGVDIEGAEFSGEARDEGARRFGQKLAPDLRSLSLDHYDWIVSIEVIEHLPDPEVALKHLLSLLRPGGGLFLTTPNAAGLAARFHRERWREATNEFHLVLFTPSGLRTLLARSGFEKIEFIRFSPIGSVTGTRAAIHRTLQALNLYGGLRATARRPLR